MSIASDLSNKLKDKMSSISTKAESTVFSDISNFLEQKSVLRSTHFIVSSEDNLFKPWQVEDFSIILPQPEIESVGYLDNLYTFPVYKGNEPVKLTLTIADDEDGNFFKNVSNIKNSLFAQGSSVDMGVFSTQGRYRAPERLKNINMTITLYHPNGTQLKPVINLSNMFLLTFEDIKYSYSSLTDYQKYSCTFVCDPVNFSIDS